ncbi:YdeI/OmpD-associated family protein [Chitinophaga caseinilytica]|uniref:YdeI/OmpD-associated family protein n=1 Tax=Chitinophaga caseinilytica TaxID=2267521 RepID=A0ABZ2YXX9_9BACT
MLKQDAPTFTPESSQAWRQWLKQHHQTEKSVWLVMYKQQSGKPVINWSEAVDEALCFGWIDSTRKTLDEHTFIQFFSRRKPNSNWSKINKDKVEKLIAAKKMTKAGLRCIEVAKQNGSWTILDEVEQYLIPKDLEKAFKSHPGAKTWFTSQAKSVQKLMLAWIAMAKRPETREKRVATVAESAGRKERPANL